LKNPSEVNAPGRPKKKTQRIPSFVEQIVKVSKKRKTVDKLIRGDLKKTKKTL